MFNTDRNIGRKEKNLRIAIGLNLVFIGIVFAHSFWLTLIGLIVLATGLLSVCGLYQLLGKNTATAAEQRSAKSDLVARALENIEDFKQETLVTLQEIKSGAATLVQMAKEKINGIKG